MRESFQGGKTLAPTPMAASSVADGTEAIRRVIGGPDWEGRAGVVTRRLPSPQSTTPGAGTRGQRWWRGTTEASPAQKQAPHAPRQVPRPSISTAASAGEESSARGPGRCPTCVLHLCSQTSCSSLARTQNPTGQEAPCGVFLTSPRVARPQAQNPRPAPVWVGTPGRAR